MEPRWAQKLDTQREPDRSPFATHASARAHVALLGIAVVVGIWAGRAASEMAVHFTIPVAASLIAATGIIALMIWAASLLARRSGYMAFGLSIAFVVASIGSTALNLLMAAKS